MSNNFFKVIDVEKKKKKLYPDEVICFFSKVLEQIGLTFDPEEVLNIQFSNLKKEEYETILGYLKKDILENDFSKKDSSVKYAFSKLLEDYIFENLNIFYNYNLYMNKERNQIKKRIDRSLVYLYKTEETERYIDPSEVILHIDEKEYTKKKEIEQVLKKKIKKEKKVILKNNVKYLKTFNLL